MLKQPKRRKLLHFLFALLDHPLRNYLVFKQFLLELKVSLLTEIVPLLIQKNARLEYGLSYNMKISFALRID